MHTRLKARWVFPVDRSPIENGLVEIANGLIADVRAARPHEVAEDLGDVAILPGLVNAHAHLEFSLVAKPFEPPLPFTSWIRSLLAYRRETFGGDATLKAAAIEAGWREAAASGTTLVGEIATDGWSASACAGTGPRVVAFRELIGQRAETVAKQADVAEAWLILCRLSLRERAFFRGAKDDSERPRPQRECHWTDAPLSNAEPTGELTPPRSPMQFDTSNSFAALSPHAPYSVSPTLLTRAVSLAQQHGVPVAMHLAETRAELEFLATGQGELADMLRGFGALPDEGLLTGLRPLDILRTLADAPRALIVHGNYLDEDEIEFLATRPHLSVVYCPRTHAFFDHEPHPWQRLLAQGVNVAIGTDGRGSNPDLSVLNELTFLRSRFADVAPQTLLEMGTLGGARALGFEANCGSLTPGKRADLVVVSLAEQAAANDPHELLFVPGQQIVQTRFGR